MNIPKLAIFLDEQAHRFRHNADLRYDTELQGAAELTANWTSGSSTDRLHLS